MDRIPNKIEIRAYYGWHEVSKEKALKFARRFYQGIMVAQNKNAEYINKHHLRGISFTDEELRGK